MMMSGSSKPEPSFLGSEVEAGTDRRSVTEAASTEEEEEEEREGSTSRTISTVVQASESIPAGRPYASSASSSTAFPPSTRELSSINHVRVHAGGAVRWTGSATASNSSSRLSARLSELTANKLQFSKLGRLYGREEHSQRLRELWTDVLESFTSTEVRTHGGSRKSTTTAALRRRRFILVTGEPGVGKTRLAESLRPDVARSGGLFVRGKFPQPPCPSEEWRRGAPSVALAGSSNAEPFAAFAQATADLCEAVVSLRSSSQRDHSPSSQSGSLADFQQLLDTEMSGADASPIFRVIPEATRLFVGGDNSAETATATSDASLSSSTAGRVASALSYQEAHQQFKYAFRRFVRAVTRIVPAVLVLDDLQWADAASLELVEALLSDREINSLLIVGCCRTSPSSGDEKYGNKSCSGISIAAVPPHLRTVDAIRNQASHDPGLAFESILLDNLDIAQINDLLMDLLSLPASELLELSYCVHRKTLGNVFFVIQYLTALHETGLLEFNLGAWKWTFNLPAIRESTSSTDNVVHLVKSKLSSLPPETVKVLPLMACLGSTFTLRAFEIALHDLTMSTYSAADDSGNNQESAAIGGLSGTNAVHHLVRCEREGLIEMRNDVRCSSRWVHDKIQEAALSLVSDASLHLLRRSIGMALWEGFSSKELEENLFLVSGLLNNDYDNSMVTSENERTKLANLFLRAGINAVERSSFDRAAAFVRSGIALLPTSPWRLDSDLALDLFSASAEVEFCLGNLGTAREMSNEVISQENIPLLKKRRAYNALISCAAAEGEKHVAYALCKDLLTKLGCKFPTRFLPYHVLACILRIKSSMKRYSTLETFTELPSLSDERNRWMMTLFDKFMTYALLCNPTMLPLIAFKGLRLTLNAGLCETVLPMFVAIGFLLTVFLSDYKGGQAFAFRAIELLSHVESPRRVEARVIMTTNTFIFHWTRPLALSLKPLRLSFDIGMATADTESACFGMLFYLDYSFRVGTPLQELIDDCSFYSDSIRDASQRNIFLTVQMLWQAFLFLTGDNIFTGRLSGEIVDEEKVLQEIPREKDEIMFFHVHRLQLHVAFVLGQYDLVYKSAELIGASRWLLEKTFPGMAYVYHIYTFVSLSTLSLYRMTKLAKYVRLAKKFASRIKTWVKRGVSIS
jgi:predicted ATPase